jgi:hypothetical protein
MFWFLIPAIPAVAAVVATKYGAKRAVVELTANEYNRRLGYRSGEGPLSPREGGGLGVLVHANSSSDLGNSLALLAEVYPETLSMFVGKLFEMTLSEGQDLRTLLQPSKHIAEKRMELVAGRDQSVTERDELLAQEPCLDIAIRVDQLNRIVVQVNAALDEYHQDALVALAPVARFLEMFPRSRVK